MDLSPLRPCIISILRQSDMNTISAKDVRLTLIHDQVYSGQIPSGADLNGRDKAAINDLIRECFVAVNEDRAKVATQGGGLLLPGTGGVPGGYAPPAQNGGSSASKKKSSAKDEIDSDEEPGGSSKKKPAKKRASKAKDPLKAKEKRAPNPNNPFNAPLILDSALSDICGVPELARPQIVKKLWEYIKGNQLQDPSNGRTILCDAKLTRLFGKESVDSFEMAKHISAHVTKKPKQDVAEGA